jgi:hypothetical protein
MIFKKRSNLFSPTTRMTKKPAAKATPRRATAAQLLRVMYLSPAQMPFINKISPFLVSHLIQF